MPRLILAPSPLSLQVSPPTQQGVVGKGQGGSGKTQQQAL